MKTVLYYLAVDGTRFEDEEECRDYEVKLQLKRHSKDFKLFNHEREEINLNTKYLVPDDVFYIIIKSIEGANTVGEWFRDYGAESPFDECGEWLNAVGTWAYNDDYSSQGWYKVEKKLDELENLLTELKGE